MTTKRGLEQTHIELVKLVKLFYHLVAFVVGTTSANTRQAGAAAFSPPVPGLNCSHLAFISTVRPSASKSGTAARVTPPHLELAPPSYLDPGGLAGGGGSRQFLQIGCDICRLIFRSGRGHRYKRRRETRSRRRSRCLFVREEQSSRSWC